MLLANANPINQPIEFTQGDTVTLELIATDDYGVPVDLTGAVFVTQILGPNTAGPIIFGNGQHTAADQSTNRGQFSLALTASNTAACGEGQHKQILTEVLISGVYTYFRGDNILTVYPNVPLQ